MNNNRLQRPHLPKHSWWRTVTIVEENLSWFPYIKLSDNNSTQFDLSPIKARDITSVVHGQCNFSVPRPDGATYAIIKTLPTLHHIPATLYNTILLSGSPFSTWICSRISLIYKKAQNLYIPTLEWLLSHLWPVEH